MSFNRDATVSVVFASLLALSLLAVGADAKFMSRCEFVSEVIRLWPQISRDELNSWTCIAENQSKFDRSLRNVDAQGTSYYGIFQISDRYWCSSSPFIPRACGISCAQLQDSNLGDDLECVRRIYGEHSRIGGDGFSGWPVHALYCRQGVDYTKDCITRGEYGSPYGNNIFLTRRGNAFKETRLSAPQRTHKIYERCELARELYYVHDVPFEQVPMWVCIARYESNYNTSAVGYLSGANSADHGIFQISDLYWCSPPGKGQGCRLTCAKLENADIADDVQCMKTIYDEHQRLSGDGYNAWTVYHSSCKGRAANFVSDCFDGNANNVPQAPRPGIFAPSGAGTKSVAKTHKAKTFSRCELAQELHYKHNMPKETVHTWLCIAQQQSAMSTAKVSALDAEGFRSFGIFQINEKFWCSAQVPGKACNLRCEDLLDNDISNDIECSTRIFNEHQRIYGNGFQAWKAYEPYCQNAQPAHDCFNDVLPTRNVQPAVPSTQLVQANPAAAGKVYERCELARELRFKHNIPRNEVSTWVCIALYQSNFVTSATGRSEHGLFQISDKYWCSVWGKGGGCGVSCAALKDADITDDVQCARRIQTEHQRLYGDGFSAWNTYEPYCKGRSEQYVKDCFSDESLQTYSPPVQPQLIQNSVAPAIQSAPGATGKVFERCELAKELRFKHNMPRDQLHMWVCIAHHESNFNTAAVGRRNADGSGDHGIFQISDLYWCSSTGADKGCGAPCSHFENSDIGDDVRCVKKIHAEHQQLFGDGFHAWAVYEPYCKGRSYEFTQGCFEDESDSFNQIVAVSRPTSAAAVSQGYAPPPRETGKTFERCELARELRFVHNVPLNQVSDWVCIALYQSNFVTSAKGIREHGLFQVSEEYWCSNDGGSGKGCGVSCSKLLDADIADDVACARRIHDEHQRVYGDGFKAWAVYEPYCSGRSQQYIRDCFTSTLTVAQPSAVHTATPVLKPTIAPFQIPTPAQTAKPTTAVAIVSTPLPFVPPKSPVTAAKPTHPLGKVYARCELAKELRFVYNFPPEQIHIWHCIAQQSRLNTSFVGSPHAVGSRGFGIFQINEKFWCSSADNVGSSSNSCGIECSKLIDGDIADDAKCAQKIFAEHERLYGKGFQAWNVYDSYCKYQTADDITDCFETYGESSSKQPTTAVAPGRPVKSKTYERCELAKELRYKHNVPQKDVLTWVCIAQHASNLVTSTVGRASGGGSSDYGLFQISDAHWCSTSGNDVRNCGVPCSKLVDDDIGDDVKCAQQIYAEHKRLSGDGFSAWKAYESHCKSKPSAVIEDCFKGCDKPHSSTPKTVSTPARGNFSTTRAPNKINTYKLPQFNQPTVAPSQSKSTYAKADALLKEFHNSQVAKFSVRASEFHPIYFGGSFTTTVSPYAWSLNRPIATTSAPSFTTQKSASTTTVSRRFDDGSYRRS